MALIRIDHVPETVKVCTPLYLILPDPSSLAKIPLQQRIVLYLLHGLSDDGSAWQRFSSIETVARDYGLVVVMPSVGRSFYLDQPNGQHYFTYLAEELPDYLKNLFGLDPSRENTLIAGLSMGGYGAMKVAFRFPERFSAAASFSGVLSMAILQTHPDDKRQEEFRYLFGDLSKVAGSNHDPLLWLQKASHSPSSLPKLYIACGRQDDLYPLNQFYNSACQQFGIPIKYVEEDGKHDWHFWDRHIKAFLKWALGEPL